MATADVVDVAATVSGAIDVFPSYARVARVMDDGSTVEMSTAAGGAISSDAEPVGLNVDSFWPEDCLLSEERKRALFWQYHRSMGCHQYVAALAMVFKGLCDNGVNLTHEDRPVVDVLVLNTVEFEVSDLLAAQDKNHAPLKVHDPITDVTVPVIATHETMDRLLDLGESVCARLGFRQPEKASRIRKAMKQHRPESYFGSVPHWWVAVVVEDQNHGTKEYVMVHLDICGAAYDPTALVQAPRGGPMVPLQVFCTPEYSMFPSLDSDLSHKFVMKAFLSERAHSSSEGVPTAVVLQPTSIRHFRCYHRDDTSAIEVTPLATFVERNSLGEGMDANISTLLQSIQHEVMLRLPVGSEVLVCNIQSQPELNGRTGTVWKTSKKEDVSDDRIPVLIKGLKRPVQLKPKCIRLPHKNRPYRTLEEMRRQHDAMLEGASKEAPMPEMSRKQKGDIQSALRNDSAVAKVLVAMQTGQMTFSKFADPEFKIGVEKCLRPPLNTLFPANTMNIFQCGLELSNHPKAGDAIKIINLMKAAKQRYLQENPNAVRGDGALEVQPGSDMMRIQASVVKRIRDDVGLSYVFGRLDELGLFVNPAK